MCIWASIFCFERGTGLDRVWVGFRNSSPRGSLGKSYGNGLKPGPTRFQRREQGDTRTWER